MVKKHVQNAGMNIMDSEFCEKVKCLFTSMNAYINFCINEVLNDSRIEPEYSAVATSNLIKCYIFVMTSIGEKLPYSDVKGCFDFNGYLPEEYRLFEESRETESRYYGSVQY